jgi:hypothetical protein
MVIHKKSALSSSMLIVITSGLLLVSWMLTHNHPHLSLMLDQIRMLLCLYQPEHYER